jgi:hypothetical protein
MGMRQPAAKDEAVAAQNTDPPPPTTVVEGRFSEGRVCRSAAPAPWHKSSSFSAPPASVTSHGLDKGMQLWRRWGGDGVCVCGGGGGSVLF